MSSWFISIERREDVRDGDSASCWNDLSEGLELRRQFRDVSSGCSSGTRELPVWSEVERDDQGMRGHRGLAWLRSWREVGPRIAVVCSEGQGSARGDRTERWG